MPAEEEDKAMQPKDQRQSFSEAEDIKSVPYLEEGAQEAARKELLSIRGNKRDRILDAGMPLTNNHMQYIADATTVFKKRVYKAIFTDSLSKARYEQSATSYVEATT